MPGVRITEEDPLDESLGPLLDASYVDLTERYPAEYIFTASARELAAPGSLLFVARIDGIPVACVGLVPAGDHCAEIKRLFVAPRARRRGLGRRLVASLEAVARRAGYRVLRLETGTEQPEAVALYETMGYRAIAAFGVYADVPASLCYEKRLRPPADP